MLLIWPRQAAPDLTASAYVATRTFSNFQLPRTRWGRLESHDDRCGVSDWLSTFLPPLLLLLHEYFNKMRPEYTFFVSSVVPSGAEMQRSSRNVLKHRRRATEKEHLSLSWLRAHNAHYCAARPLFQSVKFGKCVLHTSSPKIITSATDFLELFFNESASSTSCDWMVKLFFRRPHKSKFALIWRSTEWRSHLNTSYFSTLTESRANL